MMIMFMLFEYFVTAYEIIISILWSKNFLQNRYKKEKTVIISLMFSLIASTIVIYLNNLQLFSGINSIISVIIILSINFILFKSSFLAMLTVEGIYIAIDLIMDFIIITIYSLMLPQFDILAEFGLARISATLISKVILTFFVLIFRLKMNNKENKKQNDFWTTMSILVIAVLILSFLVILGMQNSDRIEIKILLLMFYILLLIIIILSLIFLKKFVGKQNELKDYMMVSLKNSMMEKTLQENERSLEKWKKAQHDFKHNLLYIQGLIEENKYEDLELYIEKQLGYSREVFSGIKTGNRILDIVINYYENYAQENGIHFSVNIALPSFFKMEDSDLCAILGNILENAFEAAKKCVDNKEVWLFIKAVGEMTVFKCKNSFTGELLINSGKFETTKKDKLYHGIGLKSINSIVKKYNGTLKIKNSTDVFSMIIMFRKGESC